MASSTRPRTRTALGSASSLRAASTFPRSGPSPATRYSALGCPASTLGSASFEYKLDGARIQVHKVGDDVKVYSRNLRDVTAAVPEAVAVARAMPAREIVVDGEAIALRADLTPHPFQVTMRRFGRKLDVDALKAELPHLYAGDK